MSLRHILTIYLCSLLDLQRHHTSIQADLEELWGVKDGLKGSSKLDSVDYQGEGHRNHLEAKRRFILKYSAMDHNTPGVKVSRTVITGREASGCTFVFLISLL